MEKDSVMRQNFWIDSITRTAAEIQLNRLFGFQHFHDLKWKVIGHYLTGPGAEIIAPLVIARTVGGDI